MRIGCATSSHLLDGGPLAAHVTARRLERRFVAWLQRFHLIRRLIELGRVNILALDTDMAIRADPYVSLHSTFAPYTMVTTFDYKGGFANTNIGYIYIQNASRQGALRDIFLEFERRIALALPLPSDLRAAGQRRGHALQLDKVLPGSGDELGGTRSAPNELRDRRQLRVDFFSVIDATLRCRKEQNFGVVDAAVVQQRVCLRFKGDHHGIRHECGHRLSVWSK